MFLYPGDRETFLAVGPTEGLSSGFYSVPQSNQQIAIRMIGMFVSILRGDKGARINISAALPAARQVPGVRDASPSLGSVIDLNA